MSLVLEGIRVVDVSQVAAVPMAARLMADFGADVIHVEPPKTGDSFRVIQLGLEMLTGTHSEFNYIWENYNRNKRSVTIDLSQEGGQQVLYRMLENADVFVTNLRPFELKEFNLEYGTLSRMNPKLIGGYLTGYGSEGPSKDSPAYDHTAYWARSGIPHKLMTLIPGMSGSKMPPPAFVPAFGDHMAGMCLAYGIMTALFSRERTGKGQLVEVSLFHAGLYQLSFDLSGALATKNDCHVFGSREEGLNPLMQLYRTQDGRWLLLSGLRPDRYWSSFCKAIGREDLEHDPRFDSFEGIIVNHVDLLHILEDVFSSKTLAEWKPILDASDVPWSPLQTLPEVVADTQARANEFFTAFAHPVHGTVEVVANPVKLNRNPHMVRMPAPEFSQHTEEVLLEMGYSWEEIERFKHQGIIA